MKIPIHREREAADIINTIISVAYVPKNMNENGNLDELLLSLIRG